MLEAKQSPSCHHLSLIAVESDLKAADSKVTSSKTDPFLLQNLHMERQGQAITVHRSSKRIWCKVQSCTTVKAMQAGWQVAHMPWRQGKVAASSATITCLGPLATEPEKKEQDLHSLCTLIPQLFLQMQILKFSDRFHAFPCFITANICRRHASFWAISSLDLDSPFTSSALQSLLF